VGEIFKYMGLIGEANHK